MKVIRISCDDARTVCFELQRVDLMLLSVEHYSLPIDMDTHPQLEQVCENFDGLEMRLPANIFTIAP